MPNRRERGRVGLGCAVAVVVVLVAVGLGIYFVGKAGLDLVAEQVAEDIRDNPVIREHVGEIREITLDLSASGNIPDEDVFVFRLVGSKANGTLVASLETIDADTERVTSGMLTVDGAEPVSLFPE